MKKFLQVVFYGVFALAFAWVSLQLFFQRETEAFLASLFSVSEVAVSDESVKVIVPDEVTAERFLEGNVYESLVSLDDDLSFEPGLAVSFGRVSPLVWNFHLREGVKFHDGSSFEAEDVLMSLEESGIGKVTSKSDFEIVVETAKPDPLLLSRLARMSIRSGEEGTGAYRFVDGVFERFEGYWGEEPYFARVEMAVFVDKNERVSSFVQDGGAGVLAFVPFDAVDFLSDKGFEVLALPSLEVQFLLLNFQSEVFSDLQKRVAFGAAIDREALVKVVGGFARSAWQFVSSGVFGFNPELKIKEFDLDEAKVLAEESGLKGETITVHLPLGTTVLGEQVRLQMKDVGVGAVISYLAGEDLLASFAEKKADVYFLGYKSESGDGSDFFGDIVKSGVEYNLGNYENEEVDDLIALAAAELNEEERLGDLREIGVMLDEDVFGVPLLEYQNLFSLKGGVKFEPRMDGFVSFKSLSK